MSNLPPNPYDRTVIVEPTLDTPDRAALQGTGRDFVVSLEAKGTPGANREFLAKDGSWVPFSETTLPVWGSIVGNMADQIDLLVALNSKANITSLAPVATAGTYASLTGKPVLGSVSPINLNGNNMQFLRGDGVWSPVMQTITNWGTINGDITEQADLMGQLAQKADLFSPVLNGTPQAPTPVQNDNSTRLATTAYYMNQGFQGLPEMDGVASSGDSPFWAHGNHRHPVDTSRAPLDSPVFTGMPSVPTPPPDNVSQLIATTAFVDEAVRRIPQGEPGPPGPAGDISPGNSIDTQVLFNDAMLVAGDTGLRFFKNTKTLSLNGSNNLTGDATNVLAIRNGTVAQNLRLYNTYTDASNYERGVFGFTGNTLMLKTEAAGTGILRGLTLWAEAMLFATQGTTKWQLTSAGHLGPYSGANTNLFDIGTAAAAIRTLYAGTNVVAGGGVSAGYVSGNPSTGEVWSYSGSSVKAALGNAGVRLANDGVLQWSSTVNATSGFLASLQAETTNVIAQRNATFGQTLRLYNTYTDASNYERLQVGWTSSEFRIGNEAAGTGSLLRVGAWLSRILHVRDPSNALAIGATIDIQNKRFDLYNVTDPSNYERGTIRFVSNSFNILTEALGTGVARNMSIAPGTGSVSLSLGVNGGQRWQIQDAKFVPLTNDAYDLGQTNLRVKMGYFTAVDLLAGTSAGAQLTGDASDQLAQRRGLVAQMFNVYNTYTDASNYERLRLGFNGGVALVLSQPTGTGAARPMQVGTDGSAALYLRTNTTNRWLVDANGNFNAVLDNSYDIGASANFRPRNVHVAGVVNSPAIKFPAVDVPSADPNTLDDYEEGTFTPTLMFGGASVGVTYVAQRGEYIKVGRKVSFRLYLKISSKGTSVGAASVGGLPFANSAVANSSSPVTWFGETMSQLNSAPCAHVGTGASAVSLLVQGAGSLASVTDPCFAANSEIYMSGTYFTA